MSYYGNDILVDDSIENYISLYNDPTALSIKNIEPLSNENFKVFMLANTDIRIIDRDKVYSKLVRLKQLNYFINDQEKYNKSIKGNKKFYMIPIQTVKGTIVNFIFRRVFDFEGAPKNKRYHSIKIKREDNIKTIPYMYGFYKDFENFTLESKGSSKPIILCEGPKDCIYLKQFYPYVLAMSGSSIGFNAQILRNITDKLIFVSDTDKVGQDQFLKDRGILRKLGFNVDKIKLDNNFKDVASYVNYPELEETFKKRLLSTIRKSEDFF